MLWTAGGFPSVRLVHGAHLGLLCPVFDMNTRQPNRGVPRRYVKPVSRSSGRGWPPSPGTFYGIRSPLPTGSPLSEPNKPPYQWLSLMMKPIPLLLVSELECYDDDQHTIWVSAPKARKPLRRASFVLKLSTFQKSENHGTRVGLAAPFTGLGRVL